MIFDLESKQFLSNIKLTYENEISDVSDSMLVIRDSEGNCILYDSKGKELVKSDYSWMEVNDEVAVFRKDNIYYVYDEDGERFTKTNNLEVNPGDGINEYTGEGYILLDKDGNQLLENVYSRSVNYSRGVAKVRIDGETNYQYINVSTGEVFYESSFMEYIFDDYWYDYDNDVVVNKDGTKISGYSNDAIWLSLHDDNYNYYILNTGGKLSLGSNTTRLTYAMVAARDDSGKYAIYDLYTGDKLTENEYVNVLYGCGYIYASDGNTWHVFEVKFNH